MHKIFFDGACNPNPGPTGCGAVIFDGQNNVVAEVSIFNGHGTNNQAEYSALIYALEKAIELGIRKATVYGDSKLVINQLNGVWNCNDAALRILNKRAMKLCYELEFIELCWIKRINNSHADKLSQDALEGTSLADNQVNTKREQLDSVIDSNKGNNNPSNVVDINEQRLNEITAVHYYKGVGFSVIQNSKLYAINLNPLSCSCANLKCEHINAAIAYSQTQQIHKSV
ncbi:ribonuclease HI family protein [Pseudoalteromonas sp. MelDa3]|uniref:ribonuclease HI family protein n=1 Tax=Pseudoalteromonas sp. MelDa3 TaxID=888435 RepID=UPI000CC6CE9B|nr:ribonuclease HI family protein [Pseudoalteromonas sp. MelDa3]PLT26005.1 hypothetical protein CXF89_07335 [Pseudoalteromonas sp. MelDa3]|tara:strand:- start:1779 stop:2462 length:684 start_codon:yes stop_codon:yes gene_type:complete